MVSAYVLALPGDALGQRCGRAKLAEAEGGREDTHMEAILANKEARRREFPHIC